MNLKDYQAKSQLTNKMKGNLTYFVLGLVGESGEIAEKYKKFLRNDAGDTSKLDRDDLTRELGDVLWYIASIAAELDVSLEDVAQANLDKLSDRDKRNVIRSTGDYR